MGPACKITMKPGCRSEFLGIAALCIRAVVKVALVSGFGIQGLGFKSGMLSLEILPRRTLATFFRSYRMVGCIISIVLSSLEIPCLKLITLCR